MLSILDCLPRANRVSQLKTIQKLLTHIILIYVYVPVHLSPQATLVFLLDHLSLVVSASERNKMSAQALATVMGPPLMLHSANTTPGTEVDHAQPIAVLKYLLQIWPQPQNTSGNVILSKSFFCCEEKKRRKKRNLQSMCVCQHFVSTL